MILTILNQLILSTLLFSKRRFEPSFLKNHSMSNYDFYCHPLLISDYCHENWPAESVLIIPGLPEACPDSRQAVRNCNNFRKQVLSLTYYLKD